VEILSGTFEGRTTGAPIALVVRNRDVQSGDYDALRDVFRPGHADYTWQAKYGLRDHRGGGRSSGRETLARVAAGAVAVRCLAPYGIAIRGEDHRGARGDGARSDGGGDPCRPGCGRFRGRNRRGDGGRVPGGPRRPGLFEARRRQLPGP